MKQLGLFTDAELEEIKSTSFFNYKMPQPQYLGAKYKFMDWINNYIPNTTKTILDPFAGSNSASFYFKQKGLKTISNDFMNFSYHISKGLIENNSDKLTNEDLEILFGNNSNPNYYNLMEKEFLNIFFNIDDCKFLDSFRSNIEKLSEYKQSLAFAIITRSMTRKVTMGHFAHLKAMEYATNPERIKRNASLIKPVKDIFLKLLSDYNRSIFNNKKDNKAYNLDAIKLISELKEDIDVVYFDPPYGGSHSDYQSFYHLLETYTMYWKDKKFVNGTHAYSPKRYSGFELKTDIEQSFTRLFEVSKKIPNWIISYNDRSFPNEQTMVSLISNYKKVNVVYKEYHNDVGGKGSVKGSKELLFICSPK